MTAAMHKRMHAMRLYLINPSNPLVSIGKGKESRWNRYRAWGNLWGRHQLMICLVGNLPYRSNFRLTIKYPRNSSRLQDLGFDLIAVPSGFYFV